MIISGFKNFFEKKFDELPKSYQILLVLLVVTIVNSLASAMIIMIEQPYQEERNRQIDEEKEVIDQMKKEIGIKIIYFQMVYDDI